MNVFKKSKCKAQPLQQTDTEEIRHNCFGAAEDTPGMAGSPSGSMTPRQQ